MTYRLTAWAPQQRGVESALYSFAKRNGVEFRPQVVWPSHELDVIEQVLAVEQDFVCFKTDSYDTAMAFFYDLGKKLFDVRVREVL